MTFYNLCGAAVCAAFMSLVIKEVKPNHGGYLALAVGVLFFGVAIQGASAVIEYIQGLSQVYENPTHIKVLLKALGIAYGAAITQEICKSCGENTIAGYVDAIGKAEIIIISLPLIEEITSTALKYI